MDLFNPCIVDYSESVVLESFSKPSLGCRTSSQGLVCHMTRVVGICNWDGELLTTIDIG